MTQSAGDRKRLLLTGASGKFGTKFIELFAQRFEIIALTNTNSVSGSTQHSSLFDPKAGEHTTHVVKEIKCDLCDRTATTAIVGTITDLVGPITYLVNAAADVRFLGSTLDVVEFEHEAVKQWRINVLAPAIVASALFHRTWKHIEPAKQDGSILNLSSISASSVFQGTRQASYASSKAALNMLTLYMAAEYRAYNVRVNGLAPNAFPSSLATEAVAQAALKILESKDSGKIYNLGWDKGR